MSNEPNNTISKSARGNTAMFRVELSRPVSLALSDGVLAPGLSLFDYGCGRGTDVARLQGEGFNASGWDPVHAPSTPPCTADVVNLGYVVNVIEDSAERASVLRSAWGLTREVLIVSARLDWDVSPTRTLPCGDGVLTAKGTFQKFFTQEELRDWIKAVLDADAVAAGPGIFYVFRSDARRESFLARPTHGSRRSIRIPPGEAFERNRSILEPLLNFLVERGRLPARNELPEIIVLEEQFGSIGRAMALLGRALPERPWEATGTLRQRDLLVYLALGGLRRRLPLRALSPDLQLDIRAFFGSYRAAAELGQELLFSAGDQRAVAEECSSSNIGKQTPDSLYVHISAVSQLSLLLRVFEGCARTLLGDVPGATLVKLRKDKPKLSYLCYPDFDATAHPALAETFTVDLGRLHTDHYDYRERTNPPVLHRKECFVDQGYPGRDQFVTLTRDEERAGLLSDASTIGTRDGWSSRLRAAGYELSGHQLKRIP